MIVEDFERTSVPAVVGTNQVYVNFCPDGCRLMPGVTDARTDHSSLVTTASMQTTTVPA